MRRPLQLVLVVVVVLLVVVAAVLFAKFRQTSADLATAKAGEDQAQSKYAQTIDAIAEIQDSLNAIAVGDTGVGVAPWNAGVGQEPTKAQGQEALDRIAVLRASIARNKDRIRQLEIGLKRSGVKIAGLQKMINNLKETVALKETMVAELTARVDSLQTQVGSLAATVQETQDTLRVRDQTIEEKRQELATVYYVIGTKGQLKRAGVVESKGGLLGLGKTLQPVPGAALAAFTPLDTDQQTVVRTSSSKARVLSAQPPSSYELRLVGGTMELHILDPGRFRAIRRLIILTS